MSFYILLIWRHYLLMIPAILLDTAVRWLDSGNIMVKGIRVIDTTFGKCDDCSHLIDNVLTLVERVTPLRLERIQREIRTIVLADGLTPGPSAYNRALRVCTINLRDFYNADDKDMTVKLLASFVVYRAFHGRLFSLGVHRSRRNYARFDRLCYQEPHRFLQRLGMIQTPWDTENLTERPPIWKYIRGVIKGDGT